MRNFFLIAAGLLLACGFRFIAGMLLVLAGLSTT